MTPQERADFIIDIAAAIRKSAPVLNEDETQWVRLAIQKEAQSIQLRQAVIEKSLAGLIWAGLVFFGGVMLNWATQHGYKP